MNAEEQHLVGLTQTLLDSIVAKDWETYERLCDPSLTCFEPEAQGNLVAGMEFHKFYFELQTGRAVVNTTISSPHVRLLGEVAIVSYIRLVQLADGGPPDTHAFEETRIWQRRGEDWIHVHFHRSLAK